MPLENRERKYVRLGLRFGTEGTFSCKLTSSRRYPRATKPFCNGYFIFLTRVVEWFGYLISE